MDFRKFAARSAALVVVAGALGGCATMFGVSPQSSNEAKRELVVQRADARGSALVRGDLDAAYEFLSEGSKAVISKDNFKRRMSIVPFTAYRIDKASCEGETCKVESRLTFDHRVMRGVSAPATETWVIERGNLFYVFPAV
jgi:hypothetical protein